MLRPSDAGVRVSIGVSRSGKTHGIRADVVEAAREGMPVIVVDRAREWNSAPASLTAVSVRVPHVEAAARMVERGARLCVVRAPEGQRLDVRRAALEACAWACSYRGRAGVAFPEGHHVAPRTVKGLPSELDDCINAWAHNDVALWIDSQRVAKLHSDVVENATELRLYAIVGFRDLQALREYGSPELANACREAAERMASGQSGWHVRLGTYRGGPYELTRATGRGS